VSGDAMNVQSASDVDDNDAAEHSKLTGMYCVSYLPASGRCSRSESIRDTAKLLTTSRTIASYRLCCTISLKICEKSIFAFATLTRICMTVDNDSLKTGDNCCIAV